MSAEQLAGFAGLLLSLAFSYIPGLKDWYGTQDGTNKRLVMLVCIMVAGAGVYLIGCANLMPAVVSCDRTGFMELLRVMVAAVIANQAAFLISPRVSGDA